MTKLKLVLIIALSHLLINTSLAQAPQKMSYQAVIRNSSNALITSTSVGMKISVLQGSSTGTVAYSETQTPSTNANGLVSLEIGSGIAITGTFAGINWATGPYFIKTETDPAGGTVYTIVGTNQLMSVPYALFSANGTTGPTGPTGPTGATGATGGYPVHFIGESYGGGTVFYVYDGGQHGLIVTSSDLGTETWNNGVGKLTGTTGDGLNAGAMNTAMIVAQQMEDNTAGNFAAKICADYSVATGGITYGDWYLPSKSELTLLYNNKMATGGSIALSLNNYWSSTEIDASIALSFYFNLGYYDYTNKTVTATVRGVRAF